MGRRVKDTLRAGATAVGVATALLALASTTETPDGYVHASFGGPLDVFTADGATSGSTDVLAIGDGTNGASELAALLKGPVGPGVPQGSPTSPYQVAYEAGAAPDPIAGTSGAPTAGASATAAPTLKDAAILPSKPVVDAQGKIDCSGAISCRTDPATNITTLTYADGIVAIVQEIDNLTVVAYKSITSALPTQISSLLPQIPTTPPPMLAAVAPAVTPSTPVTPSAPVTPSTPATPSTPVVASVPTVAAPGPEVTSASINPGPPAPTANLDPTSSAPKVTVTTPAPSLGPGASTGTGTTGTGTAGTQAGVTAPKIPSLGGIVDSVKGALGSALGAGASSKPGASSSAGSTTSSQTTKSASANNSKG